MYTNDSMLLAYFCITGLSFILCSKGRREESTKKVVSKLDNPSYKLGTSNSSRYRNLTICILEIAEVAFQKLSKVLIYIIILFETKEIVLDCYVLSNLL